MKSRKKRRKSAIKMNEIMPFAATWLDLETIILSKASQREKDKYHMVSVACEARFTPVFLRPVHVSLTISN